MSPRPERLTTIRWSLGRFGASSIAKVMELAPKRPKDHLMVVNLSGRGDKDIPQVADILRGKK